MRDIIKKVPIPTAGVALGLAALGNLLQPYAEVAHIACGALSLFLVAMLVAKLIMFPSMLREDMKNSVFASVSATFFMTLMQLAGYLAPVAIVPAFGLWCSAVAGHFVLMTWFTLYYIRRFKLTEVFPTYFICYVGIIVAAVTSPVFGAEAFGQGEGAAEAVAKFDGIYFPKGSYEIPENADAKSLSESLYNFALAQYEKKEAAYGAPIMRELERVVMLRVVDEYWMDNIDAMEDLKQGIGLRAYGQHDPVIAYKEEGYEMFQAMITAIREETVRRMFLVRLNPTSEVKREKVAKETGASGSPESAAKPQPIRKAHKVGPNDPCPCGSGKKYKKCCRDKDIAAGIER